MPSFKFNLLTHSPDVKDVVSTCLGDTPDNKFRSAEDTGKAVKMGTQSNYLIAQADEEIEGFIDSVRGDTVNAGFSFGGVSRGGRHKAVIGAGQGATTAAAVLDLVVADAQAAAGVAGPAKVKTGAPGTHKWRIISILSGEGFEGTEVILERA